MNTEEIRKTVKRVYREFGTTDPFRICCQKGIIVMFEPLGSLNAHYTKIYRIPAIVVNSEMDELEAAIACLHELGHLFLGHNENKIYCSQRIRMKVSPWETAANQFAVEFRLLTVDLDDLAYYTISQIAVLAGIPESLEHLIEI